MKWPTAIPPNRIRFFHFMMKVLYQEEGFNPFEDDWSALLESLEETDYPSWHGLYEAFPQSVYHMLNIVQGKDRVLKEVPDLDDPFWTNLIEFGEQLMAGKEVPESEIESVRQKLAPKLFALRLQLMAWSHQVLCILVFKTTIPALLERAWGGFEEALFKLVSVDKTFLCHPFAHKLIAQAEVQGDFDFFSKLAAATKRNLHQINFRETKRAMAVYLLWTVGFSQLPVMEMADFLEKNGIWKVPSETYFRTFVRRLGLTKYQKKVRQKNAPTL